MCGGFRWERWKNTGMGVVGRGLSGWIGGAVGEGEEA